MRFGEGGSGPAEAAGRIVRTLVDGAIALPDRETFDDAVKNAHRTARIDSKGYVCWGGGGVGRAVRVHRPELLARLEEDWLQRDGPGRWRIKVRADGAVAGELEWVAAERGDCDQAMWAAAVNATARLRKEILGGPGRLLARLHTDWPVAREYVAKWLDLFESARASPALAHIGTVEVRSLGGRTLGLIVMPLHPLRTAWQAAYDTLAANARYDERLPSAKVTKLLEALDGAQIPAMLPGLSDDHSFLFADTLGFHAAALVRDTDKEPRAAVAVMAAAFGTGTDSDGPSVGARTAEVLGREVRHYLSIHEAGQRGRRLDLLRVHALRPGDGATAARALGHALASPGALAEADEPNPLCFSLDLIPATDGEASSGRFLSEFGRRRRAGSGQIQLGDRWMSSDVLRPGNIRVPRLAWARRKVDYATTNPAHLAFAFDVFESRVVAVPEADLDEPKPLHVFGLVARLERKVVVGRDPLWRAYLPPKLEGERLPDGRKVGDRMPALQRALAKLTARGLGGDPQSWPVIETRLSRTGQDWIDQLHRTSDWVVTVDRNPCLEYFDAPNDRPEVYDRYVIDCVPERGDLGCLQLVTSTSNIDEVRRLLDGGLGEMGLSASESNTRDLLRELKALSGRLAIRLAGTDVRVGELVRLALMHAACKTEGAHKFPSLRHGVLIPVDEIADVLPWRIEEEQDGRRADLIYVRATPGRSPRLKFRFIEVKFRRHLRTARDPALVQAMTGQMSALRERWTEYFFSGLELAGSTTTRALRRSSLARLLGLYVERGVRHGLEPEAAQRLAKEVHKLATTDRYELGGPGESDVGYIFCPEFRSEPDEAIPTAEGGPRVLLFGPAGLPDRFGGRPRPGDAGPPTGDRMAGRGSPPETPSAVDPHPGDAVLSAAAGPDSPDVHATAVHATAVHATETRSDDMPPVDADREEAAASVQTEPHEGSDHAGHVDVRLGTVRLGGQAV